MSYLPAETDQFIAAKQHDELGNLNRVLHLLSQRDQEFANSLIAQHGRRNLTDKQMFWVRELAKRGVAAHQASVAAHRAGQAPAVAPDAVRAVAFSRLAELFAQAGRHAVVVLRTSGGRDFRLSVAGERSQNPGHINVTDTSKSFESRVWFGRITPAGGWVSSRKVAVDELRAVEAALAEFNADPAKAAAEYGHAVGSCCFCGRELTDERSVTVGYGPVCAERWSLPWGEVPGKLSCQEVHAEQAQRVAESEIPF